MLTWFIVVLAWILCAFVSGFLAGNKDRKVWRWFFIGLPFGPFALIAISALEKRKAPTWTCPGCKRVNDMTSNFCGYCGHERVAPRDEVKQV